jgi:AcrR family transcriptional regulator
LGKGTVYLHWKTREDLFRAVFEREAAEAIEELIRALRPDPNAWMLHRMAPSYFLIIMRRPLLTAVFPDDSELLGELPRPDSDAGEHRDQLTARAYFELLAEHGLLQADLRPEAAAYAFLATRRGWAWVAFSSRSPPCSSVAPPSAAPSSPPWASARWSGSSGPVCGWPDDRPGRSLPRRDPCRSGIPAAVVP